MKFLEFCRRVDDTFTRAQKTILILLCIAITAINIAQVAGRYLFFYSIPWSEQLSVVLFIVLIFCGQNLVTKQDGEVRIEVFGFNKRLEKKLLIGADILCLLTVAVLFVSSILFVRHASRFPQVISSLQLPYFYVFSFMSVGFFLIFFSRLAVLLRRIATDPDAAGPAALYDAGTVDMREELES
ncbi:MAG: TRAP transporter small permease [Methylobacteriaceae bacterium]|jgi:TRAP-type C4-dicarboxylate transport system permease small subunit|nr:TRAP transporter small permease [Methylobacteriaceae bacterium]